MQPPKISVITVTYNSVKTLENTIQSVVSQEYPNLEYIIIDGASTDGTMEIVNRYRSQISFVSSEPDKGISDAFNKGIGKATGEIIGIINSDDTLLPGALQTVADHYSPDVDVYSGISECWNEKSQRTRLYKPDIVFDRLKPQYAVAHPSRFIRRDAYEKYGLYEVGMRYVMDMDLLCRFYQKGARFLFVDAVLTRFKTGGTTSDSLWKKKNDYRLFVRNFSGNRLDFLRVWWTFVVKCTLINGLVGVFGEEFRYKCYNNRLVKKLTHQGK